MGINLVLGLREASSDNFLMLILFYVSDQFHFSVLFLIPLMEELKDYQVLKYESHFNFSGREQKKKWKRVFT